VQLDDGRQLLLPTHCLERRPDGGLYVPVDLDGAPGEAAQHMVIPLMGEQVKPQKQLRKTGMVRIKKKVRTEQRVIAQPLMREDVTVDRVVKNQIVTEALPIRFEGDTMIVPLLEEVLVVEKRLVLREEIHIRRNQSTVQKEERFTLRREEAEIERCAVDERPT
jgi:uncharacterized protein (TIGR02271 family)